MNMNETRETLHELVREVVGEIVQELKQEIERVKGEPGNDSGFGETENIPVLERGVLTEKQVRSAAASKCKVVRVTKAVAVTPLARDAARSTGIHIKRMD